MKEESKGNKTRALEVFCAVLLSVAVIISFSEIVAREVFHISYDFMIDLSVWFTIWALMLLLGPLLAEGGHVAVDFVRDKLKGKPRFALDILNALCSLIYGAVITVGGIIFVHKLYVDHVIFPRYFRIPQWIVEICVPIGVSIYTVYAGIELVKIIRKQR